MVLLVPAGLGVGRGWPDKHDAYNLDDELGSTTFRVISSDQHSHIAKGCVVQQVHAHRFSFWACSHNLR